MNEFKRLHPLTNLVYFIFVIGFSCVFMNPLCLAASAFGSICFILMCGDNGKRNIIYYFIIFACTALINPIFNHRGLNIITYLPGGNPLTVESITYGLASGVMLVAVIAWFSAFGKVMTGDKLIYLFGKILPSLSLVFSMTLRFVPRFISQLKKVETAQRGIGKGVVNGSLKERIKNGMAVLSVTVTWALENSIDSADSMKARGYGLEKRSNFSLFKFTKKDGIFMAAALVFGIYFLIGSIFGAIGFEYFPTYKSAEVNIYSLSVYAAYVIVMLLPLLNEITEEIKWKALRSKI